mmetsp:Transcript_49817/g.82954  ORF Transcript_49817/g.82954 Transcript_49817/m.82954 type:complete len:155 (+) Transcript_49817:1-465(+)
MNRQRLQSESDHDVAVAIDRDDTITASMLSSEEKIDNYMEYGHTVTVVGLKLNQNLVEQECLNCRTQPHAQASKLQLLKKKKRLSAVNRAVRDDIDANCTNTTTQHLIMNEEDLGRTCGANSNSLSVQHDVEMNSNWSNDSNSYQQLPKIDNDT